MGICYSSKNVYVVRFFDCEEKNQLLDTVEDIGICIPEKYRLGDFSWPGDTCTFAVDVHRRRMEYLAQPLVCAAMASCGVRFYSVTEFCRLAGLGFPKNTRCPIFHVPHDGEKIPDELMRSVCISREAFLTYHEKMRDTAVWRMIPAAYHTASQTETFSVSRLLCDVERFIGPEEIMERYGMGFCYERAFDGTVIKTVTDELKEKTRVYYDRHHARMDRLCDIHKRVMLFDMHSYSDEIVPPSFLRGGEPTPDVCIGTNTRYTPEGLTELAERRFREAGYSVRRDYPYSGCYVPNTVSSGAADCDLISLMLEFNKRIYLSHDGNPIRGETSRIRGVIEKIAADCVEM